MKLNNGEILNAKEPLQQLIGQKFPALTSLALATLVRKLNDYLIPAEEVRDGLVKQYGEPNPDDKRYLRCLPMLPLKDDEGKVIKDAAGNVTMVENPNWPMFVSEMNELLSHEFEIVIQKVQVPSTFEIEPAVLMALEKFIKVG